MNITRGNVAILSALALMASFAPGLAHASPTTIIPAGQLSLAQIPVRCGSVATMIAQINDIGQAKPGWILLNPRLFSLPPPVQHFWYAHECAHHMFGADEQKADCWAIQRGRDLGWFRVEDFKLLRQDMQHFPGDATHLPGPARLAHIRACFDDSSQS